MQCKSTGAYMKGKTPAHAAQSVYVDGQDGTGPGVRRTIMQRVHHAFLGVSNFCVGRELSLTQYLSYAWAFNAALAWHHAFETLVSSMPSPGLYRFLHVVAITVVAAELHIVLQ